MAKKVDKLTHEANEFIADKADHLIHDQVPKLDNKAKEEYNKLKEQAKEEAENLHE